MSAPWIVAFAFLATAVTVMGAVVLGVIRRCLPLLEHAEALLQATPVPTFPVGLPPGTPVADFSVIDSEDGTAFGISDLRGRRSIVLFLGPGCPACETLIADLRDAEPLDLTSELIVVVEATLQELQFPASVPFRVVYQDRREVSRVFGTSSTPHAFAVDELGVIVAASVPNTMAQLVQLAATAWKGGDAGTRHERLTQRAIPAN